MRIKTSPTHQAGFFHFFKPLAMPLSCPRLLAGYQRIKRSKSWVSLSNTTSPKGEGGQMAVKRCLMHTQGTFSLRFPVFKANAIFELWMFLSCPTQRLHPFDIFTRQGRRQSFQSQRVYCGYQISWLSIFLFSSLFFLHLILSVDVAWVRWS